MKVSDKSKAEAAAWLAQYDLTEPQMLDALAVLLERTWQDGFDAGVLGVRLRKIADQAKLNAEAEAAYATAPHRGQFCCCTACVAATNFGDAIMARRVL